jgi:hypothetical protein
MAADPPQASIPSRSRARVAEQHVDAWLETSFKLIEHVLIAGVAIALVVLSVMSLWDTVVVVRDELAVHDITKAITSGIDTAFLTVILLELLHTVIGRQSLARQAPEFIVIGITSGIRHGLGLVATGGVANDVITRHIGGHTFTLTVPGSGSTLPLVESLAINSGSVFLLVVALWLVRNSFGSAADEEDV